MFLFLLEIMVGETEEKNKVFIFTIFDSFGESKMLCNKHSSRA